MVVSMSEGRVTRYKKDAKADMIRNNKTQIRCPCRTCKLQRWIDPDSGQLEDHLLRRGFMRDDFDEELAVNGVGHHEDLGEREDEESLDGHGHDDEEYTGDGHDRHDEEGDVDGHDHHEEGEEPNT